MFCLNNRGAGRHDSYLATQHIGSAAFRRGLIAAGTVIAGLTATGPALADTGYIEVRQLFPSTVKVNSDGANYTTVTGSSSAIQGDLSVNVDAEFSGRVKSWAAWPELQSEHGDWTHFKSSGDSASYSIGSRPKEVNTVALFSIPRQAYAAYVTAACNEHANALRQAEGMSDEAIFAQDRVIKLALGGGLSWEMSGLSGSVIGGNPPVEVQGDTDGWYPQWPVTVSCLKAPPPRVPPTANDPTRKKPKVKSANLKVIGKSSNTGACSVNLVATIETKKPTEQVKFRFESNDGQKSDIKSVVTGADATGQYAYDYPLPSGGTKTGLIRIAIEDETTKSGWEDYEVQCGPAADGFKTVLPPKAFHLEAIATGDKAMHRGLICPVKAKVYGILKGRGEVSGAAALFADGKLKTLKQYSIKDGETIVVEGEYAFDWTKNEAPQQDVKFAMNVSNKVGDLVDQIEKTQSFTCRKPEVSDAVQGAPGGFASGNSEPSAVTLSVSTIGKKVQNGYVCPEKVRIHGFVQSGNEPLTGTVALFAGGSLQQQHAVDLEKNWGHNYDTDYVLSWNGAALPEQTLLFALKFANQHGHVVKTMEETESFACQKIVTTGVAAVDGLSTGQPKPTHSQQATVGQLALQPATAIQAPKGRVRSGRIRLSGGKPDATYKLTFLRKSGGSYTAVNAAQLPKQMKGQSASFPLKALTGSRDWRLEVCPVGKPQGGCKTSDFRLPLIKAPGGAKASGQQQGTPAFIVPGALK